VGCGHSAPTRFYLLQPLSDQGSHAQQGGRYLYGIGPVELADYLHREQITNRRDQNEIAFSEFDHWAEPLDRCVIRVLSENLSVLLQTDRIESYPWLPSLPVDYKVRLRVPCFDGTTGGQALLVAYWSIHDRKDALLVERKSVITEKTEGGGYNELVKALNRALEKLSREIAGELEKIAR
jgi:uncharacterized lipoprotein YmbA